MSFSFEATAGASQSTTKPRLSGNTIHLVNFDGVESQDYQGKDDPTKTFKVLKFKFSNDLGYYEHTIFEPREKDFKREETSFSSGKNFLQPSRVESMMLFFKHVIDAFVPELAKQIDKKEVSITAKNWDAMRILLVEKLKPGIGKVSKIKLLKSKDGDPQFPGFFTGLTKDGQAYVSNNFIGEKVAFTAYEIDRIKKASEARPTAPSQIEEQFNNSFAEEPESNEDLSTLDFNL